MEFRELFSPAFIGNLQIKNRIIMAPMLVGYASPDGEVTGKHIHYYEARARGGVGLIIVEAACVDPAGQEGFGQLRIDSHRYVEGLKRLVRAIKAHDTHVFIQLFHAGRQTSAAVTGTQPVAPSPLACPVIREIPRELSPEEIVKLEDKFVEAARHACEAGFDGIELHAAHGYLINQFLSAHSNKRRDDYGGSLRNRMRFLLNIIKGIKTGLPQLAISVRLNIDDFVPGGLQVDESIEVCQELEAAGADVINCSSGTYESGLKSIEPASYREGWRVYLAGEVKRHVKIPVVAGGLLNDPRFANELVASRQTDFIFLGRSLLADSEWANKVREGRREEIRPCILCNNCIESHFRGSPVACTVNPFTGREGDLRDGFYYVKPARASAIVVGSGPAGMQAAISLKRMGLDVSIYEKDSQPGGLLNLAALPPFKYRIKMFRDYLLRQLYSYEIPILLNQPFTSDLMKEINPDYLVVATGSKLHIPAIKGADSSCCASLEDVLRGNIVINGKNVVIVGGGSNGCETADFLLAGHNRITIVEQQEYLAPDMEKKNRRDLMNRLEEGRVVKKTGRRVVEIGPGEVLVQDARGNREYIEAEHVIFATGYVPNNELYHQLRKVHPHVFLIGDADRVQGIRNAVLQGEMVAAKVMSVIA